MSSIKAKSGTRKFNDQIAVGDLSKRRVSIFGNGDTPNKFLGSNSNETMPINEDQAKHLAETNNFKKEIESYLEGIGGGYQPDFGYEQMLNFDENKKWKGLLDYIWGSSKDERISTVIKTMKGK